MLVSRPWSTGFIRGYASRATNYYYYHRSAKRKLVTQTIAYLESHVFLRLWQGKWIWLNSSSIQFTFGKGMKPPPFSYGLRDWALMPWAENQVNRNKTPNSETGLKRNGFRQIILQYWHVYRICSARMDLIGYGSWDVGFSDTITRCSTIKTMCQTKKKCLFTISKEKKHDSFRKSSFSSHAN